jgi:hypothetical protein
MARRTRRSLVLLALVALAVVGAWRFRDAIPGPWNRPPVHVEVSEEAAASADGKLARLRDDGDTVSLSGVEFTSYVRFRMAARFALDLETPVITFVGETVRVDGRLPKDRVPMGEIPRAARAFVPDTADVAVSGGLRTVAPGRAALRVTSASFARVPLGRDDYVSLMDRVRPDEAGIREDEIAFQLPSGVGSAVVSEGELVLFPDARRE